MKNRPPERCEEGTGTDLTGVVHDVADDRHGITNDLRAGHGLRQLADRRFD